MKNKRELLIFLFILAMLIGVPTGAFALKSAQAKAYGFTDIVLRTPEDGNVTPEIHVKKGQLVKLRITSADVTHGFAIGDLKIDAGQIHPGKFTYIEFTPQEAGTFSYYCTIVCSPLHSYVRGTMVVED